MHTDYCISAMRELRNQQVRLRRGRRSSNRSARRSGSWASSIRNAPTPTNISAIGSRITGPRRFANVKFSGRQAAHDLYLFVEDLSDAANVRAEAAGEGVVTVENLARRFNVSTKTISRWRRLGLVRPAVRHGRPQAGGLFAKHGRAFHCRERGAGAAGGNVQPIERWGAGVAGPPRRRLAPGRRVVRRGRPPPGPQDRPQPGNGPLHPQAVRPGASRSGPVSRQLWPDPHRDQAEDQPAASTGRIGRGPGAAVLPDAGQHLPHHRRDARQRILELPLDYIPNREFARAMRLAKREARIVACCPRATSC